MKKIIVTLFALAAICGILSSCGQPSSPPIDEKDVFTESTTFVEIKTFDVKSKNVIQNMSYDAPSLAGVERTTEKDDCTVYRLVTGIKLIVYTDDSDQIISLVQEYNETVEPDNMASINNMLLADSICSELDSSLSQSDVQPLLKCIGDIFDVVNDDDSFSEGNISVKLVKEDSKLTITYEPKE